MHEKVEQAKHLAQSQFANRTDKAGVDYFSGHLSSVAALVETEKEKIVAYLHDILEDTDYPEAKLREQFGDEIVDAVCLVTHRESMDEAGYLAYIRKLKASGNELAIAVKIADLTNNSDFTRLGAASADQLKDKDRKRWEKYQKSLAILKGTEGSALDKIRGSLIGGAAGDALGYEVEFYLEEEIFYRYGESGIQEYELDPISGKALISDDTQMTLFTANGILVAETRLKLRGIGGTPHQYVAMAYQDWLRTQELSYAESQAAVKENKVQCISWLNDVPELYSLRAPGRTCLSALRQRAGRSDDDSSECFGGTGASDFNNKSGIDSPINGSKSCIETPINDSKSCIDTPINDSKGCGGVMRVAPMGLKAYPGVEIEDIDREAAEIAAITHGHPLGYLPAAVLAHIVHRCVYGEDVSASNLKAGPLDADKSASAQEKASDQTVTLKDLVLEAKETVSRIFEGTPHMQELCDIIDLAVTLSENDDADLDNIHLLGKGWVAEEALGIATYCALKYQNDFSAAIIAAVNHEGDSDSTGAVTGNILGAWLGYDQIDEKWKQNLELFDVILEMADDLFCGCRMEEYSEYYDPDWMRKYGDMRWKKTAGEEV